MNCKKIHTDMIFYLNRELSDEKMEAIGRHLETCDDCRQFAEMLKSQLELIDKEKRPEVNPYFFTRLSARLDENPVATDTVLPAWAQAVAFSVLLAVAVSGGIYLGNQPAVVKPNVTESNWLMINDFESEPIETFLLNQP